MLEAPALCALYPVDTFEAPPFRAAAPGVMYAILLLSAKF
jgi:hypothetical protein